MSRRLSTVRSVHAGRVALLGHTATFLVMLAALPLADSGAQLWAQSIVTGSIEGVVRARDTRRPLADVIVRVEGTTRASLTGADGRFSITAVTPGTAWVVARRFGFADQRDSVAVRAGEVARLELLFTSEAAVVAPMVVSATRESQRRQDATVTIDVLDGEEVRRARAAHPSGLLNRLPGVHVSELSGEGHSLAMRSPISTKPLFLYLEDGIPTRATGFFNHNALYEVNLPQSGGLEIMKGPGTALYGSDAIGGVVNVLTRPAPASPGAEVTLEGGGHGYTRGLVSGGFTRGTHGVRADLNVTRSDNWKEAAPFSRESGTLRWDSSIDGGWSVRTVISVTSVRQQDVPPLSANQFASSREINRATIAFRTAEALRASVAVEREQGSTLWSLTPFVRSNVMELLPSWQLTFAPQIWDTRNRSAGLLAKVRRDFAPWRTRVVAGADIDWSPGSFTADRIAVTAAGPDRRFDSYTVAERQYDYDVRYAAASPYVHVETSPFAKLRVDLGLRADITDYDYDNKLGTLETGAFRRPASTGVRYSHLSPKLGAVYEFTPQLALYGSFRHGFRAPSQGQLFQQNSAANTVGLQPVTVESFEAGLRGGIGSRFGFQLAAYDMRLDDDILTFVTAQNTREANNAGRTRHHGVELGVTAVPLSAVRVDASYSASSQRYVQWVPQAARAASGTTPAVPEVSYSGNLMEQAPRDLANVLVTWSPSILRGGRLAAEWSHTGAYAMDPANVATYGGHAVVHLHANMLLRPDMELFARVTNVGDRAYAELAAYDAFQLGQYTPGAPRTVYAGVKWNWTKGGVR